MSKTPNIFDQWLSVKQMENDAIALRKTIEEKIIAQLEFTKDEGSTTFNRKDVEPGSTYKIECKGVINRSIDQAVWENVKEKIPENLQPVKYKAEPVKKGIDYLKNNEPDTYKIFAECLTAKPGKTGVKVTKVAAK